ncbi:amidohydrolase [Burkholderia ambifaria]|jgi:predicted amidohydrolase YtcJ|uniref:amidohydrolase n=1 Tax=Burkholderia TaxID=32008 RepID=UPI00158C21E2|nr:amidohydrolase [Burkholderia ambifaria]
MQTFSMNNLTVTDAPRSDRYPRYAPACSCRMTPSQFLEMVEAYACHAGQDLHWTTPRRLVQPFHWTCASQGLQKALLQGGFDAVSPSVLAPATAQPSVAAPAVKRQPARQLVGSGVDKALLNGKVFTCDARRPWCEALAIQDGRIAAAGTVAEIEELCSLNTEVFDLGGRVVIPGFNDAHMHHTPDPTGVRLPIDPVVDPPFEEVGRMISEAVAATRPGTWIYGVMGVELINDRSVDRVSLDRLAPEHPVILLGLTNHTNVVNTPAMARLGIEEEAPDPLGGFFDRLPGTCRLSGRIHEYAQWAPQRCFASMATVEEGAASIRALAADCVQFGITTIQNMSWTPVARYVEMLQAADVPIRVRLIRFPPAGPEGRVLHEGADLTPSIGKRFGVSGTKWILDGTSVERAAAMGRPYADDPSTEGRENFSLAEVCEMMRESVRADAPLLLHAIGPKAVESVIRAAESLPNVDWAVRGLRMEHGDGLDAAQIERARNVGLMVVQNPTHFLFPQIYGPRFGAGTPFASFRTLMETGLAVGIGSDGPLNPFLGLMAALTHPARPEEGCSMEQAVIAYTLGSAQAEQQADRKGMLAPGYLADLAVLSQDIFTVTPDALPATRSLLTLVEGETVYQAVE